MGLTRVLVVDDRAEVVTSLAGFLEADDNSRVVGTATSGEEAVLKARELNPDLVLMDFAMQDIDGVEAASRIRSERPATEVVILSVYAADEHAERARRAGIRAWINKSAPPDRLLEEIERLSRERQADSGD